jgi:putative ABC transport system permease protein
MMGRPDLVATARVAARQMKRHRGSTVLLALLVAVPVALATWSMSILPTLNPTAADQAAGQLGNADFRIFGSQLVVPENLPAGSVVETVHSGPELVDVGGQLTSVNVRRLQPDATLDQSRSVQLSGRWPYTANEAAVSPRMAQDLRLREGSSIHVGDTDRTIVGIVRSPLNRNGYDVRVVEASADTQRGYSELLVRLPSGSDVEQVRSSMTSGFSESRASYNELNPSNNGASLLAELLPLIEVVLIAAALFTVTAARQRRMLGLMSAVGASSRQCALVVLSYAVLIGDIGSTLGVGVGLAIAAASRQWLAERQSFVADSLQVPVGWVALSAFLAILALVAHRLDQRSQQAERASRHRSIKAHERPTSLRPVGSASRSVSRWVLPRLFSPTQRRTRYVSLPSSEVCSSWLSRSASPLSACLRISRIDHRAFGPRCAWRYVTLPDPAVEPVRSLLHWLLRSRFRS